MRAKTLCAALAVLCAAGGQALAQEKGGLDETGPYKVVEGWFKPGVARWNQPVVTVTVDNPNRIIIGSADEHATHPGTMILGPDGAVLKERRGTATTPWPESDKTHLHQLMVLNGDGKVIEDWKQWDDLIVFPHTVQFDPYDKERHLWVIDRDGQQILKFTNDGKKLVFKLGERNVTGTDHGHFNKPANMVFMPDGSFYIADGYVNSRVIKFDKTGKFLLEWGSKGSGHGQFNMLHGIAVDAQKRIYIADRRNNNIQVFDENGKFLDVWEHTHGPTRMVVTQDQSLWLASADIDRISKFDLNGKLLTYWGTHGENPGATDNPHSYAVDQNGTLYVADTWNNRVQKFVPKDGADKSRLIGQDFVFPAR